MTPEEPSSIHVHQHHRLPSVKFPSIIEIVGWLSAGVAFSAIFVIPMTAFMGIYWSLLEHLWNWATW